MSTEKQFNIDFPNAKYVSWTEATFAEATFYDNNVLKTAYYDTDNTLVGSTTDVAFSALPDKGKYYITKKYPGYTIKKAILFDDNEANSTDMFLFNNSFEDEDSYVLEIAKRPKDIILKVSMDGDVSFIRNH